MDIIVHLGKLNRWHVSVGKIPPVQYIYYDDGTGFWRKGVRDGYFVLDKSLMPGGGFEGQEGINWINVWYIS